MAEVSGAPVCHRCGAPIPGGLVAYCSPGCRAEAHRLALAGVPWKPSLEFAEWVRTSKIREKAIR